jgi:hypothetical protein
MLPSVIHRILSSKSQTDKKTEMRRVQPHVDGIAGKAIENPILRVEAGKQLKRIQTRSASRSSLSAASSTCPIDSKKPSPKLYENPCFAMQRQMEQLNKQREFDRQQKQKTWENRRREAYALNAVKKREFEASLVAKGLAF